MRRSRTQLLHLPRCLGLLFSGALLVAAASGAQPDFVDATLSAGVDYVQLQIADPPQADLMLYMTGGAAAGDYDGDGCIDLYVTRRDATDILFRNQCDGTFQDATVAAGLTMSLGSNGAGWGDVDNDGDLDLYVTTHRDTRYYLFVNDGAGQFTEEAVARGAALQGADEHFGYSVAFGDYDLDGWVDLFVGEWRHDAMNPTAAPSNARLLRNLGPAQPGHFSDETVTAGVTLDGIPGARPGTFAFSPSFADMDNDGYPELLIASDFGESRLFWNDGDGTFTDGTGSAGVGTEENGMGSAIADFDHDGFLDWFVTSIYDPGTPPTCSACPWQGCPLVPCWGTTGNRLFRNQGNRTFADVTDAKGVRDGYWGWGAALVDYDNDGDLDPLMTNGLDFPNLPPTDPQAIALDYFEADPMCLWSNDGAGPWTESAAAAGTTSTGQGKGLLVFDYDGDGDVDVFIANNGGHPVLYRNDVGNQNDWLRVEVSEAYLNRFALGARVEVTATLGGPTQTQEIGTQTHFLGQSELTAHFGLGPGPGTPVYRVKVTWPRTGKTQTLFNVARNQTLSFPIPRRLCGLLGVEVLFPLLLAGLLRRGPVRVRG